MRVVAVTALSALLFACGGGGGSDSVIDAAPDSGVLGDELFVEVEVPDSLNNANINNVNARFQYGGSTFELIDNGDRFLGEFKTGVRDPSVVWRLELYEVYQGQLLVLMQTETSMLPETASTLRIDAAQLTQPDDDFDGGSNLAERNADAEPFDSFSTIDNPLGQTGVAVATLALQVDLTGLANTADDNLWVTSTIDGQVVNLRPRGGPIFATAVNFASAGDVKNIVLEANALNRSLIANWSGQITVEPGENSISLTASDLNINIDSDADGLANLQELDISDSTATLVDVADFDQIPAQLAPQIDGSLNDEVWRDRMISSGQASLAITGIWIDKLLKTTPSNGFSSGEPTHELRAVHDQTWLYLAIRVIDEDIVVDSGTQQWQDDSVELYIDGDNSRFDTYDGVNDLQLIFIAPHGDVEGTLVAGQNSAPVPAGIEFAISSAGFNEDIASGWSSGVANLPAVSTGFNVEIAIPLDQLGAGDGDIIGIDVHINDDDNGGIRDAKWNWAWTRQPDRHWQDPTLFGAARLR